MGGEGGVGKSWITRAWRRLVDERGEARSDAAPRTAVLAHRGREQVVQVSNISASGAMVGYAGEAAPGDSVTLRLLDQGAVAGQVRWVREGQIGINFAAPPE